MTAITFEDAAPVKVAGTGRKADPNPFEAVVKDIAGKTNKDDSPVAKKFTQPLEKDEDKDKTTLNRIRRQLQDAGNLCNPQVTVRVHVEPATDGKSAAITFWTTKKQQRPRTATASTDQTNAVTQPEAEVPAK